jgi:hypothetical protein
MSITSVRAALEVKLAAMTPALATAYENAPYTPVAGTPYQAVYLLPIVENPTMGDGYYRHSGIFQISLFYPIGAGTKTITDRAALIQTAFKRGTAMTSGAVTVRVTGTPDIGQARVDGDRFFLPVKIIWMAGIIT